MTSVSVRSVVSRPKVSLGLAILLGLGIRLPLAFVPGYAADVFGSEKLAQNVVVGGLPHVYALALRQPELGVYPPLYQYMLALVGLVYQRFFSPDLTPSPTLDILLKLVPILGDCLIGLVVYLVMRRLANERAALWAALAFLFNPAVIYNSAYWGMFGDSLYTLCILASLFAVQQERVGLAWMAITLSVLIKPQAVVFIPLVAWSTLRPGTFRLFGISQGGPNPRLALPIVPFPRREGETLQCEASPPPRFGEGPGERLTTAIPKEPTFKRWMRAGAAVIGTFGLVWLPFILAGTWPEAIAALKQTVGLFPFLSANAHNIWYFFSAGNSWVSDAAPLLGLISARTMGLGLLGLAYLLALWRLRGARGWPLMATAAYIAFAFFMLSTEMHENYIFPALALLAITWQGSRRFTKLAIIISFTALVNMVLHNPPLQSSLQGMPYIILISLTILNSGVNVLVFAWWTGLLLFNPNAEAVATLPRKRYPSILMAIVTVVIIGWATRSVVSLLTQALAHFAPLTPQQLAAVPHRLDVTFEDKVRLVGYAIDADTVHPGDTLTVTLYWQALAPLSDEYDGYAVFIHLVNSAGTISAQSDVPLGSGDPPASQWKPGETFARYYRLEIQDTATTPKDALAKTGLYVPPDGPRLAARDAQGQPVPDNAAVLAPVKLVPRLDASPTP